MHSGAEKDKIKESFSLLVSQRLVRERDIGVNKKSQKRGVPIIVGNRKDLVLKY